MAKKFRITANLIGLVLLWLPLIPSIIRVWGVTIILLAVLLSEVN